MIALCTISIVSLNAASSPQQTTDQEKRIVIAQRYQTILAEQRINAADNASQQTDEDDLDTSILPHERIENRAQAAAKRNLISEVQPQILADILRRKGLPATQRNQRAHDAEAHSTTIEYVDAIIDETIRTEAAATPTIAAAPTIAGPVIPDLETGLETNPNAQLWEMLGYNSLEEVTSEDAERRVRNLLSRYRTVHVGTTAASQGHRNILKAKELLTNGSILEYYKTELALRKMKQLNLFVKIALNQDTVALETNSDQSSRRINSFLTYAKSSPIARHRENTRTELTRDELEELTRQATNDQSVIDQDLLDTLVEAAISELRSQSDEAALETKTTTLKAALARESTDYNENLENLTHRIASQAPNAQVNIKAGLARFQRFFPLITDQFNDDESMQRAFTIPAAIAAQDAWVRNYLEFAAYNPQAITNRNNDTLYLIGQAPIYNPWNKPKQFILKHKYLIGSLATAYCAANILYLYSEYKKCLAQDLAEIKELCDKGTISKEQAGILIKKRKSLKAAIPHFIAWGKGNNAFYDNHIAPLLPKN